MVLKKINNLSIVLDLLINYYVIIFVKNLQVLNNLKDNAIIEEQNDCQQNK